MADGLEERLEQLADEFTECEARLADPAVVADRDRYVELSRRHAELRPIAECARRLREARGDLAAAGELLEGADDVEESSVQAEVDSARTEVERLTEEARILLVPKDPLDERDVILEIRGAEGGEEANLFARDLFEMYRAFAQRRGWRFEVLSSSSSELGGLHEVTVRLSGDSVWSRMKFEAGPHRVQRVPVTESQGRVHTSSATVVVLPEADEVELEIDPGDLQVDVFRASGPGGQSVNTTDSAVRLTHLPTGLVVSMQDEKSQLQNRARALVVLRARLLDLQRQRHEQEASGARRSQIGGGGRSEKVRTYNVKENRVTDHRIGLTLHQLDRVLAGDLDEISDALIARERADQLTEATG